jgi:predicted metal-binding membrane protein
VEPLTLHSRPLLFKIVAREHWISAACLVAMCGLAWWWLWRESALGLSSSAASMMGMAGTEPLGAHTDVWNAAYLGPAFAMWAIMMVAMMLPSASPMILLHANFSRRGARRARSATLAFALTYLLVWTVFAALAAIGQAILVWRGLVEAATLELGNRTIIVALLATTALYQLSSLKYICLSKCRSPANFLLQQWRPGISGAIRMGLAHGIYCIGCCGFLMLVLFVGGAMNLAWVFLIAVVVLVEKYAPPQLHARWLISGILLAAGAAVSLA